jgi:hypothetical protein
LSGPDPARRAMTTQSLQRGRARPFSRTTRHQLLNRRCRSHATLRARGIIELSTITVEPDPPPSLAKSVRLEQSSRLTGPAEVSPHATLRDFARVFRARQAFDDTFPTMDRMKEIGRGETIRQDRRRTSRNAHNLQYLRLAFIGGF